MPNAERVNDRPFRPVSVRPVVLLAIEDDEVRARFTYALTASGFDVEMTLAEGVFPAVIVATLSTEHCGSGLAGIRTDDPRFRGVPVIAVAPDASDSTRDRARREGCAAVCVATCSGAALAAGIRAVLQSSRL